MTPQVHDLGLTTVEAGILIGWLHADRARHIREFRKTWERFLAAPRPWG
jgi:hypothetical protein